MKNYQRAGTSLLCCSGCASWRRKGSRHTLLRLFNTAKGLTRNKDGERPFARACSDRTKGKGFTQRNGRFRLDMRETFFMMMVVGHGLPREVVDAQPLERSVQGQVGQDFEQTHLVKGILAHGREASDR